jgi:hypothetical protein
MNTASSSTPQNSAAPDPAQKPRLIIGIAVWIAGWVLGVALIPVVNASDLAEGLKTTLNGILLLGFPKLFLIIAIAIMGKPGFAYLKSLIASHFRRIAPPATVSPMRYRIGLILFVAMIVLSSIGDYVAADLLPMRQQHPRMLAFAGDLVLLASLFLLGGDFWDKLRALFIRDAKAVFPEAATPNA